MRHLPAALAPSQNSGQVASPTDLGAGTRTWLGAHAGAGTTVIGGTSAVSAAAVVRAGG